MVDDKLLESTYQENLEEDIVTTLAETRCLSLETAMDIYYRSKLSGKIHDGTFGVQYLDFRNLVEILMQTEPELFV